jgi:plastocyanin
VRKTMILLVVLAAALVAASPAGAKTWTVWLGEQARPPTGTPKGATLNQFFPRSIQIQRGDKVRFTSATFHTATYLGGAAAPPPLMPDPTGATYENILGFDGGRLWFNGLPKFLYNPQHFGPVGGTVIAGRGLRNSGAITANQRGRPQGVAFTFPQTGSFKIICLLHPGMSGTVVVKPKASAVPSAATVKAQATRAVAAGWAASKRAARTTVPAGTVYAGVRRGTASLLAFLPARLSVRVGTTVRFVNRDSTEIHNMAWGEATWLKSFQDAQDLFPFRPGAPNQVFPIFVYGSEPPGGYVHKIGNHGNSFLGTPLIDNQPGNPPMGLAGNFSVTFSEAGTFHYICQLHGPDMSGDIVVS